MKSNAKPTICPECNAVPTEVQKYVRLTKSGYITLTYDPSKHESIENVFDEIDAEMIDDNLDEHMDSPEWHVEDEILCANCDTALPLELRVPEGSASKNPPVGNSHTAI